MEVGARLHPIDHLVVIGYLAGMLVLGWLLAKRKTTDVDYFLGGRRLPWFAVGVSVIASLLSSITYLSEPGNIWFYGYANIIGKMIAIPIEMIVVFTVCIPFFMRFRFTSAYEYLEHRFDRSIRLLGVFLFLAMVTAWMGVIVLVSSRAIADATGLSLYMVIGTVGIVATLYTLMGGIRAVVWTDVVQVTLLVGGGLFVLSSVGWHTASNPVDWWRFAADYTSTRGGDQVPFFSLDPAVTATTITLMLNMLVWHVCTHSANQMTLQRYFSTKDSSAARRSFVTGSLLGVFLNLMLATIGAALVYFYVAHGGGVPDHLDVDLGRDRDRIFPHYVVTELPPGVPGAIFAALLAAAMSTIDSGVNSFATVVTVELTRQKNSEHDHVRMARVVTLIVGLLVTAAAVVLDPISAKSDILSLLPRSFNCFLGALGGLFLIGMFVDRADRRSAWPAGLFGLATALSIAYSKQLFATFPDDLLTPFLSTTLIAKGISFTWILPVSCTVTVLTAWLLSGLLPPTGDPPPIGYTWRTRNAVHGVRV